MCAPTRTTQSGARLPGATHPHEPRRRGSTGTPLVVSLLAPADAYAATLVVLVNNEMSAPCPRRRSVTIAKSSIGPPSPRPRTCPHRLAYSFRIPRPIDLGLSRVRPGSRGDDAQVGRTSGDQYIPVLIGTSDHGAEAVQLGEDLGVRVAESVVRA